MQTAQVRAQYYAEAARALDERTLHGLITALKSAWEHLMILQAMNHFGCTALIRGVEEDYQPKDKQGVQLDCPAHETGSSNELVDVCHTLT